LKEGIFLNYQDGPKVVTRVLIRGPRRLKLTTEEEIGVLLQGEEL
jgi:hypothetical protein